MARNSVFTHGSLGVLRHLSDPENEKQADILKLALIGVMKATIMWLGLMLLLCIYRSVRSKKAFTNVLNSIVGGQSEIPLAHFRDNASD